MSQSIVNAGLIRSAAGRREFKLDLARSENYSPAIQIDATYAYDGANTGYEGTIRPGTIMARITATKLWVPCKRTRVKTGGGATSQAIPVDNAAFFKAGDTISVGADTGKTIASVNYSTNTITVSDTAFAFADGEAVIGSGALAGAEIARGILDDEVDLWDEPSRGLIDKASGRLMHSGAVVEAQLLGDYAACIASGVTHFLGHFSTDVTLGAN